MHRVWELWPYLSRGASLDIPPDELRSSPEGLRDWIVRREVTFSFVPTPVAEPTLLHREITNGSGEQIYGTDLSVTEHWVLDDHRIVGTAVMPGTAYLEMARAAVETHGGAGHPGTLEIRDAFFLAPLAVRDDEIREVRIVIDEEGNEFSYKVVSKPTAAEN